MYLPIDEHTGCVSKSSFDWLSGRAPSIRNIGWDYLRYCSAANSGVALKSVQIPGESAGTVTLLELEAEVVHCCKANKIAYRTGLGSEVFGNSPVFEAGSNCMDIIVTVAGNPCKQLLTRLLLRGPRPNKLVQAWNTGPFLYVAVTWFCTPSLESLDDLPDLLTLSGRYVSSTSTELYIIADRPGQIRDAFLTEPCGTTDGSANTEQTPWIQMVKGMFEFIPDKAGGDPTAEAAAGTHLVFLSNYLNAVTPATDPCTLPTTWLAEYFFRITRAISSKWAAMNLQCQYDGIDPIPAMTSEQDLYSLLRGVIAATDTAREKQFAELLTTDRFPYQSTLLADALAWWSNCKDSLPGSLTLVADPDGLSPRHNWECPALDRLSELSETSGSSSGYQLMYTVSLPDLGGLKVTVLESGRDPKDSTNLIPVRCFMSRLLKPNMSLPDFRAALKQMNALPYLQKLSSGKLAENSTEGKLKAVLISYLNGRSSWSDVKRAEESFMTARRTQAALLPEQTGNLILRRRKK